MASPRTSPVIVGRRAAIAKWLGALAWHWIAIVAASLLAAWAFAAVGEDVFRHESGTLDDAVRTFALAHQNPVLLRVFTTITQLGSTVAMIVLVALIGVWLWRNKHRHIAAIVVTAPAIAVGLFNGLKAFFQRNRPDGASKLHVLTYSFPSGHSTVATAVLVTCAYVLTRERMIPKRVAIPAAIAWPLLVGASRVYLDVHWATDVLGGWALGLLVAGVSAALYERARSSDAAKSPPAGVAAALLIALLAAARPSPVSAQERVPARVDSLGALSTSAPTLFRRRDAAMLGVALAASATVSLFDAAITQEIVGEGTARHSAFGRLAVSASDIGGTAPVAASLGLYLAGRLSNHPAMTAFGSKATAAVVTAAAITFLSKGLVGRDRPSATSDPDEFHLGRGFLGGSAGSFPSGHTSSAFAFATVVVSELPRERPLLRLAVGSLAIGGATLVGVGRVYDNKHWASDVVGGAAIGVISGWMAVRFAHRAERTPDASAPRGGAGPAHLLEHLSLLPDHDRGARLVFSLR